MKLRSKIQDEDFELGEVVDATIYADNKIELVARPKRGGIISIHYKSLAELFEHWEDVPKEEPKEFWYIGESGKVHANNEWNDDIRSMMKSIGNYFETREEAEKAVEKLKAWKRLEDRGFINENVFNMNLNWCNPDDNDWEAFHTLFGD